MLVSTLVALRTTLRESRPFSAPRLEREFLTFYRRPGVDFMMMAIWLGVAAFAFFFVVEKLLPAAGGAAPVAQYVRASMIALLIALGLLLSSKRDWVLDNLPWFAGICGFILLCAIANLIHTYPPQDPIAPWSLTASMMFASFLIYGFARLPIGVAFAVCAGGATLLVVMAADHMNGVGWLVRMAAQLAFANVAGLGLALIAERRERSLFLQTRALNEAGAELALRAQEASAADEAKTRLLAGVSHDLRQPMTGLVAHAAVLAESVDLGQQAVRERAVSIQTTVEAMDRQLQKLLDIARNRSEAEVITLQRVDLRELLASIERIYHEAANRANVELHVRPPSARRAVVLSQRNELFEVLSQLVFNAIKYSSGVQRARVLVGVRPARDGAVRIVVTDNGAGIAPEHLPRIFEPYYAVQTPHSARYGGRGLGLAQAHSLVAAMPGHSIAVQSRVGRGSTFSVSLPAAGANEMLAGTADDAAGAAGAYVLLVDNDVAITAALKDGLQRKGLVVEACLTFGAAVEALRRAERDFDLLILDYSLDEPYTGIDVLKAARAHFDTPPPAVIITGDIAALPSASELPPLLDILPKPVPVNRLLERVRQALASADRHAAAVAESGTAD